VKCGLNAADDLLLDAYGVRPDRDRIRYYRLLWDLGP
jgi:aminoglycoside phosphotransferase